MIDAYGRNIDYMRISITDRCNLHCLYCMPFNVEYIPGEEILSCEEIERICRQAVKSGIRYVKITGGEPLVREDCVRLVRSIKNIDGIEKVTLTTNGILLPKYLQNLKESGIDAVNISLDSINERIYREITGFNGLYKVLDGIKMCIDKNISVKVNCVLIENRNDEEWEDILELSRKLPLDVRFIEVMPIGYGRKFKPVNNEELIRRIMNKYPNVDKDTKKHGYGPAVYYHIPGFNGSVGFISAIHGKFCSSCNRIRLTSQGIMKPCLCYDSHIDLKKIIRNGGSDEVLLRTIKGAIEIKPKKHCFEKLQEITEEKAMIKIGG